MKDKKALIQWYKDNGIDDVIEEFSVNHFDVPCEILTNINNNEKQKIALNDKTTIVFKKESVAKAQTNTGEQVEIISEEKIEYNNTKKEFNFNYIYQNLANKYRDDNMRIAEKSKTSSVEESINEARKLADSAKTVDDLRNIVENFEGHLDIKNIATNTVFGEGNTKADVMIVGEAPGNNEDIEGRPFCGQSGQLLDLMFKSIGKNRSDLYITNTLFWRPPGNRTPTEEEINICRPFVEKHIALVNPKIIVFMGATALKDLIQTKLTITKARRQLFDYTNQYLDGRVIKTTPLFHPSYLLRQSNKKKDAWGDLLFLNDVLKSVD